eukprot:333839-Amphidinium_carterae.2
MSKNQQAKLQGKLGTRRENVNKGDLDHPNIRSRLVGQEIKAGTNWMQAEEILASEQLRRCVG